MDQETGDWVSIRWLWFPSNTVGRITSELPYELYIGDKVNEVPLSAIEEPCLVISFLHPYAYLLHIYSRTVRDTTLQHGIRCSIPSFQGHCKEYDVLCRQQILS